MHQLVWPYIILIKIVPLLGLFHGSIAGILQMENGLSLIKHTQFEVSDGGSFGIAISASINYVFSSFSFCRSSEMWVYVGRRQLHYLSKYMNQLN